MSCNRGKSEASACFATVKFSFIFFAFVFLWTPIKGVGNLGTFFSVLFLGENILVKGGDSRPHLTVLHTKEGNSSSFERCKTKLSLRDLISKKTCEFSPILIAGGCLCMLVNHSLLLSIGSLSEPRVFNLLTTDLMTLRKNNAV